MQQLTTLQRWKQQVAPKEIVPDLEVEARRYLTILTLFGSIPAMILGRQLTIHNVPSVPAIEWAFFDPLLTVLIGITLAQVFTGKFIKARLTTAWFWAVTINIILTAVTWYSSSPENTIVWEHLIHFATLIVVLLVMSANEDKLSRGEATFRNKTYVAWITACTIASFTAVGYLCHYFSTGTFGWDKLTHALVLCLMSIIGYIILTFSAAFYQPPSPLPAKVERLSKAIAIAMAVGSIFIWSAVPTAITFAVFLVFALNAKIHSWIMYGRH